jgi:hypothetical protein
MLHNTDLIMLIKPLQISVTLSEEYANFTLPVLRASVTDVLAFKSDTKDQLDKDGEGSGEENDDENGEEDDDENVCILFYFIDLF